jgi:HAD superfamily hydrolase (TIGR01509 family)
VRGVLLDVDGTLVDSNDAHARAWVEALAEAGHQVRVEAVRPLIGMGGDKLLPAAAGVSAESPEGKQIAERRSSIFRGRYLPRLRAFPGVRDLLARMRGRGLRVGVASSAQPDELKELLRIAGATELMPAAASADEVEGSKPDPDVVQAALRKIEVPAAEAVLIGDTPYDVEAALRAGAGVIAFRCGGWTDDRLAGALAVYDGPWDLAARFETSPLS